MQLRNQLQSPQVHVFTSKTTEKQQFFRERKKDESMDEPLANAEPLDDPTTKPVPKPLEHQTRKSLIRRSKHGKTRRGYGKNKINNERIGIKFSLLGTNSNGLRTKKESLYKAINELKPSVVTVQETKYKNAGSIKIPGYQIFEKLRNNRNGEGF